MSIRSVHSDSVTWIVGFETFCRRRLRECLHGQIFQEVVTQSIHGFTATDIDCVVCRFSTGFFNLSARAFDGVGATPAWDDGRSKSARACAIAKQDLMRLR